MEERVFKYGKYKYTYFLERSDRKTFSLVVMPNLRIVLKAPENTPDEELERFLVKKWVWLKNQMDELKRYKKTEVQKSFASGESFYYLGRQYMLRVEKGCDERIKISPGLMTLVTKNPKSYDCKKAIYDKWYFERCEEVFKKELASALKEYSIKTISRLKIREMKSRWGSYQKDNTINLNPKLLQASRVAIRYVITHELCHIEHKNHDENFYNLLDSRMSDWKSVKENLEIRFG